MTNFALPKDNHRDSTRVNGYLIIYSDELARRYAKMMASSIYVREERFFEFPAYTIGRPPGVNLDQDCSLETSSFGFETVSALAANNVEQSSTSLASLGSHQLEYFNPTVVQGPFQYTKPDVPVGNLCDHGLEPQTSPMYNHKLPVPIMNSEHYSVSTYDECSLLYNLKASRSSHIVSPACFYDNLSSYFDLYQDSLQGSLDSVPSHLLGIDTVNSILNSGVKSDTTPPTKPPHRLRCPSPGCPQTLKRVCAVKRHYICFHTLIRPYCCDLPNCSQSFPRSDYLLNHKRKHLLKNRPGQI